MSELVLLGFVADHHRNIQSGAEYSKYFPAAAGDEKRITNDGTVSDTVKAMHKIIFDTLADTAKIAPLLKGKTLADTCQNIWSFIYNHIQYKNDRPGVEELRRPRRSWAERTTGVDCDCMSLFAGSILANLGIDFKFRITKYAAGWQHVYVIVPLPTDTSKYYVIDCVLDKFNYEKPYTDKFDHTMNTSLSGIPISMLGDVSDATAEHSDELKAILSGAHFEQADSLLGATDDLAKPILDSILSHITATRDYIRKNPDSVTIAGGATNHLKMLDYAIANWGNPELRTKALDLLEAKEEEWNNATPGVSGLNDSGEDEPLGYELDELLGEYAQELEGLGKLRGKGKKFFGNIKKAVKAADNFGKKVATKIVGEKVVAKIEKAKEKAKEVLKKVGAVIKKFIVLSNPLSLAARAGFLLAMKANLFHWAQRMYPALLSESEALSHGINSEAWNRSVQILDKFAGVFSKIGGKRNKLEKYIRNGRAKKRYTKGFSGLDGLGEPSSSATAASVIAAATALLTAAAKVKSVGGSAKDYEKVQKAPAKKPLKGLGEGETDIEVPETEQFETDSSGNIDESKNGLKKFIAAIRKFFQHNKHAEPSQAEIQNVNDEAAAEAADPNEAKEAAELQSQAEEAQQAVIDSGGTKEAAQAAYDAVVKKSSSGDGFFAKAGRFVKENPGKSAAIGLLATTALALCIPSVRKAVTAPFSRKTNRPFSSRALSGTSKKKSNKKSPKKSGHKKTAQGATHVKRVLLGD